MNEQKQRFGEPHEANALPEQLPEKASFIKQHKKLLIIIVSVVILLAAIVGAAFFLLSQSSSDKDLSTSQTLQKLGIFIPAPQILEVTERSTPVNGWMPPTKPGMQLRKSA